MARYKKSDILIPAGLIFLCLVPAAAGLMRVVTLLSGTGMNAESARFFAAPKPAILHILTSLIFGILGALQFSPGFRREHTAWHRAAGRLLVTCGLISALSGLWLTLFYPHVETDGPTLYYVRLFVGAAMTLSIVLAFAAVLRRDFTRHRAWMIRGYAIGLGAGTQVFTHLPWVIFVGTPTGLGRDAMMAGGWLINMIIAEWLIRRRA